MSICGYTIELLEINLFPPNIVFTSKRNFSKNKRNDNSLTKLNTHSNYTTKERTTSKYNSKANISLNLNNRPVCKRLEILFHLWNAGKKK